MFPLDLCCVSSEWSTFLTTGEGEHISLFQNCLVCRLLKTEYLDLDKRLCQLGLLTGGDSCDPAQGGLKMGEKAVGAAWVRKRDPAG